MTKTNLITASIPMKPFLVKFIQVKENLQPDQALLVPGDSMIGLGLDMLLMNKSSIRDDRRDSVPDSYSDSLKFAIQDSRATWGDMFITNTRIIRFNSMVNAVMYEILFHDILNALENGQQEKEAIYRFINRYQIFDVNFDALKKASLRWRERKGFPLFRHKKTHKKAEKPLGFCPEVPHAKAAFLTN